MLNIEEIENEEWCSFPRAFVSQIYIIGFKILVMHRDFLPPHPRFASLFFHPQGLNNVECKSSIYEPIPFISGTLQEFQSRPKI